MKKTYEFGGTNLRYGFAGKQSITIDDEANTLTLAKGGLANALNGEKTYDISQITAVQIKKHGFMPGYMQLSVIGNRDTQGYINGLSSENAVTIYDDKHYNSALEIKKYVEENRNKKSTVGTTIVNVKSAAEQIKEFKELLDMGVISQEEFDAKKKELLGI